MVRFTIEQVQTIMGNPKVIRNISVIAHVDHGKTTLTDSLVGKAGIINSDEAGTKCFTDRMEEEIQRGITITSTGVSLYYSINKEIINSEEDQGFLVNLIDSPGHIDFSAEVTAALRVTDGALIVVDCVEGVCTQTETVLRQALAERIRPVLVINKIDRLLFSLEKSEEEIFQQFEKVINGVNEIISQYSSIGNLEVSPAEGTVCFCCAKLGFGFTITKFAQFYSQKMGVPNDKLMKLLWGNHYYDQEKHSFTSKNIDAKGENLERGFCKFILAPILKIGKSLIEGDVEEIKRLSTLYSVPSIIQKENQEFGIKYMEFIFRKWIPVADSLLEMIVLHLPSPLEAQKYRCEILYTGNQNDECAESIKKCDPNGPLVMYVSKMIPSPDGSRFYAFGRVFSGKVFSGQNVKIIANETSKAIIKGTKVWIGNKYESINECPCGNTIALTGIDQYIIKSGTITTDENASPIASMKFSVAPVVRIAVKPKNASEMPQLVAGLQKLSKFDQCIQYYRDEANGFIVAGVGELHIEVCMHQLRDQFAKIDIVIGQPVVSFRETIKTTSSIQCLVKSGNKLNRLTFTAEPISESLRKEIENGSISINKDFKGLVKNLINNFGWDQNDAKKLWTFSIDSVGNLIVDMTKGIEGMNEIRESICNGFEISTKNGPLCGEPVSGVRVNIVDAMMHKDASHRNSGQITPAARRGVCAAILAATPVLEEPIYKVEISAPQDVLKGIHSVLSKRKAQVIDQIIKDGNLVVVQAYLPVAESFGFDGELKLATSSKAFPTMSFDHWEIIEGDAFTPGNRLYEIVQSVRKRKGFPQEVPTTDKFIDRL